MESGARFVESMLVLSEHRRSELPSVGTWRIGAPMIFERFWQQTGCAEAIRGLLEDRNFSFAVERAIFLEVLHRLLVPDDGDLAQAGRAGLKPSRTAPAGILVPRSCRLRGEARARTNLAFEEESRLGRFLLEGARWERQVCLSSTLGG